MPREVSLWKKWIFVSYPIKHPSHKRARSDMRRGPVLLVHLLPMGMKHQDIKYKGIPIWGFIYICDFLILPVFSFVFPLILVSMAPRAENHEKPEKPEKSNFSACMCLIMTNVGSKHLREEFLSFCNLLEVHI